MYSFELFKYVSVGQSARGHKKKKKGGGLLRHRSGSIHMPSGLQMVAVCAASRS